MLRRLPVCLALALVLAASSAGVAQAKRYQRESFAAFEQQLNKGEIRSATFNKKAHTLHLLLNDGRLALISYPSHEQPQLAAQLRAKGVAVTVQKKAKAVKKAVHHTLRYIAGGIAVLVIAVVIAVLLVDRRRKLGEGAGDERPVAPPAQSGADPE